MYDIFCVVLPVWPLILFLLLALNTLLFSWYNGVFFFFQGNSKGIEDILMKLDSGDRLDPSGLCYCNAKHENPSCFKCFFFSDSAISSVLTDLPAEGLAYFTSIFPCFKFQANAASIFLPIPGNFTNSADILGTTWRIIFLAVLKSKSYIWIIQI